MCDPRQEQELIHILFHAYHAKLKHLGLKAQTEAKLKSCVLNPGKRNAVPSLPKNFSCLWKKCSLKTSCPRQYYRHVDGHVGAAVKDADGIIFCEWKGVILYTRCIKKNGSNL